MDETEQVRGYLERQIETSKSRLDHYLTQKSEAEKEISRLSKTLEMFERMLNYLDRADGSEEGQGASVEARTEEAQPYAGMTIAEAALHVLREAGIPLHVTRIWEALQAGGKTSKAQKPTLSLTASLLRDGRFENIGGNMFRIKEVATDENQKS